MDRDEPRGVILIASLRTGAFVLVLLLFLLLVAGLFQELGRTYWLVAGGLALPFLTVAYIGLEWSRRRMGGPSGRVFLVACLLGMAGIPVFAYLILVGVVRLLN